MSSSASAPPHLQAQRTGGWWSQAAALSGVVIPLAWSSRCPRLQCYLSRHHDVSGQQRLRGWQKGPSQPPRRSSECGLPIQHLRERGHCTSHAAGWGVARVPQTYQSHVGAHECAASPAMQTKRTCNAVLMSSVALTTRRTFIAVFRAAMSSPSGRCFSALLWRHPSPSYADCNVIVKRICGHTCDRYFQFPFREKGEGHVSLTSSPLPVVPVLAAHTSAICRAQPTLLLWQHFASRVSCLPPALLA